MAATKDTAKNEEFVTIVSVGNSAMNGNADNGNVVPQKSADVPFVTVLSIGQQVTEEEVIVYRLPGEKLGFGLKFEGGVKSQECVRRLFIQSCAPESPAGRARSAWGALDAGDEIVCIDRIPVTSLTRLECVRCLKDSNVAVKLLIRHSPDGKQMLEENLRNARTDSESNASETEKLLLPPPVPPRKIHRKNVKDNATSEMVNGNGRIITKSETNQVVNEFRKLESHAKSSYENVEGYQTRKGSLGKQSPGRPRRSLPTNSTPPPEAQVYTDLFCHEKENGIHIAESESDDTGSSISTVIDRLSTYSSFPGSVENSIPSTPTLGPKHLNLNALTSKNIDEKFIAELPARMFEEFNSKEIRKTVSSKITTTSDIFHISNLQTNHEEASIHTFSTSSDKNTVISNKVDETVTCNDISDANNNTNSVKIISKVSKDHSVDAVDSAIIMNSSVNLEKIVSPVEVPKPLPRTLNKKNIDTQPIQKEFVAVNRPYEEALSPTKLQNIETWLQDAIDCNLHNFDGVERHEYEREVLKPEVLPRLIDFVPKMAYTEEDRTDTSVPPVEPVAAERKHTDYSIKVDVSIDKDPEVSDDMSSDYGGDNSPHLETIGEDDEDSPNCQNLPIIKITQQSPSANTEPINFANDIPPKISLETKQSEIVPEPRLSKPKQHQDRGLEECGVAVAVSRGTRSPPDGRENPPTHQESLPVFTSIVPSKIQPIQDSFVKQKSYSNKDSPFTEAVQRSLSYEPPYKSAAVSKSYGRGKDAKSEGSVKDKIAMFSSQNNAENFDKKLFLPKPLDTKQPTQNRYSGLYNDSLSKSYESLLDSSYKAKSNKVSKSNQEWNVNGISSKNHDAVTSDLALSCTNISYENKNAFDIDRTKDIKITPFEIKTSVRSDKNGNSGSHKSTIDLLIEQRRKSMTKLRGLVIPDSPCISNLPEIKSRDSLKVLSSNPIIDKTSTLDRFSNKKQINSATTAMKPLWDTQSLTNNVPKYSPAFKRKPLQIYGPKASVSSAIQKCENKNPTPSKPPRLSLDNGRRPFDQQSDVPKISTLPTSFRRSSAPDQINQNIMSFKPKRPELFSAVDAIDNANLKIMKAFSDAADSDNDSAVSSTQSSYLSTVSSPTPSLNTVDNSESDCSSQSTLSRDVTNGETIKKHERIFENGLCRASLEDTKRNVCRSLSSDTSTSVGSSNSSTLTSGSQASCSSSNTDTGSHRILKPRSVEAINRKNILASAKCRSGKDKFGSPLIERKFSDDIENTDENKRRPVKDQQQHQTNGNEMIKYNIVKNGSLSSDLADLKVAFTTLIEDKCSPTRDVDSTCSDTGSDSDDKPVVKTIKRVSQSENNVNHAKCSSEQTAKSRRSISNKANNIDSRQQQPVTNGDKSVADAGERKGRVRTECESSLYTSEEDDQDQEHECFEVRLSRASGGGVGVILAGGVDCEAKEVTIHKVLQGSAAERDGRLCKGDKVISINGQSMKGVSHAQSVAILKDPQPEVSIVVRGKKPASDVANNITSLTNGSPAVLTVVLEKADAPGGAGLGISLEGGGNKPLLINKLFTGGAASRSGQIIPGSQLLAAGGTKLIGLTRTEAWGLLRALPSGPVSLVLRPP